MKINCVPHGCSPQDLSCLKCSGVKDTNMPVHCSCAGDFKLTFNTVDFGKQLVTLQGIARYYKMTLLDEMIAWIGQANPGLHKHLAVQID